MKCKHGVLGACALCIAATKRSQEFETMKQQITDLLKRVTDLEDSIHRLWWRDE